ncbi:MAG: copper-binding protein [Pseudomonadota bacterium]
MKNLTGIVVAMAFAWTGLSSAYAENEHAHADHAAMAEASSTSDSAMSEGEVRKINKETGKITIKHGPLANLDMPGMTMLFRAQDPAMLDQVKEGDKIRFVANKINGVFTVTKIELTQ